VYDAFDFVRWHPECVDMIPKNGSKAVTLLKLAEQLGIKQENVIAFGDGMNDREMLKEVGLGIAMGNSSDEVKRQADMVTASNEQDGIWQALVKLKLISK
jgi:Cof subfamily protein (haloacid dehalogenase superfamily)